MTPYRQPASKDPPRPKPRPPWLTVHDLGFGSTFLAIGFLHVMLSFVVQDARPHVRLPIGVGLLLLGIVMVAIARHIRTRR